MISVSPFFRSSKISFDKSSFFLHNSLLMTPFSGVVIQGILYEGLFFCSFWETSGPLQISRMIFGRIFQVTASFRDFNLPESFLAALDQRGFTEPTPVQAQVLSQPDLSRDMVVQARTGSGKTLGFLLPILSELEGGNKNPRVLVLSPTRELAMQNANESEFFGKIKGIGTAAIVGGMSMEHQIFKLKHGTTVVVGTPGRVLDHVRRGTLDLSEIETVVLDEGDSMMDMGFREELEAILDAATSRKRTWLFSATMPEAVFSLAQRYLNDPLRLELNHDEEQHADIVHRAYLCPSRQRMEALVNVLLWERPQERPGEVAGRLQEEGFMALALNGDMTQRERSNALESFRSGRIPVLVATNVAARGLDVQGVSHVIQLGLPDDMETFVHRSGRTGRAGHEGSNILILTPSESGRFKFMIRGSQMRVEWQKVPDIQEISIIQREVREEALLSAEPKPEIRAWAESLLEKSEDGAELAAKLLSVIVKDIPTGYALRETLQRELDARRDRASSRREGRTGGRFDGSPRERLRFRDGASPRGRGVLIRVSKGRNDQEWSVGRILGALCSSLGVNRNEIGNIKMRDSYTEVELSPAALDSLNDGGRSRLIDRGLLDGGPREPRLAGPRRERRFDRSGERLDRERFDRHERRPRRNDY